MPSIRSGGTSEDESFQGPQYSDLLLQRGLERVLAAIRKSRDIQCGLVYYWNADIKRLVCCAYGDKAPAGVASELSYGPDDRSFAAMIYRLPRESPGKFEADPASSGDVDHVHRQEYGIDGPLLGVPLESLDGKKVGVLVLWNRRGCGRDVEAGDLEEIGPLANLAASCIEALNYQRARVRIQGRLLETLRLVQAESDRDKALHLILRMNLRANFPQNPLAFDRVRVYSYSAPRFKGLVSEGMDQDSFSKKVIMITNDQGAQSIEAITREGKPRVARFEWRVGFDRNRCEGLEGPSKLKWIAAPLIHGGRLLGMIEADNANSERPIPTEACELLEAMSAMAAGAIAAHEVTQTLANDHTPKLKDECELLGAREEHVYALILMHLTCHLGLRFQRAFYFNLNLDSDSLVFRSAVGSIRPADHAEIAGSLDHWEYEDLLREADPAKRNRDRSLEDAMREFTIKVVPEIKSVLLSPQCLKRASRNLPIAFAPLLDRVKASCVLTSPVKLGNRIVGVFMVDSPFDGDGYKKNPSFTPEEERSFRNFVRDHVTPIFEKNRYINNQEPVRKAREEEIFEIWRIAHCVIKPIVSKLECFRFPDKDPEMCLKIAIEAQRSASEAQERLMKVYNNLKAMSSSAPWGIAGDPPQPENPET